MYDPYDEPLSMEEALALDAEKLRAMTGEDHYFMLYDPDVWIDSNGEWQYGKE